MDNKYPLMAVEDVKMKPIEYDPILMWFSLKEYIESNDNHTKEDLLAKMVQIEILQSKPMFIVKAIEEHEKNI